MGFRRRRQPKAWPCGHLAAAARSRSSRDRPPLAEISFLKGFHPSPSEVIAYSIFLLLAPATVVENGAPHPAVQRQRSHRNILIDTGSYVSTRFPSRVAQSSA